MQDNDGGGVCQIQIKGADHQIFSIFAKGSVFNLASQYSPSSFAVFKKRRNSSENCRKAVPFCYNVLPVYQLESCLLASFSCRSGTYKTLQRKRGGETPSVPVGGGMRMRATTQLLLLITIWGRPSNHSLHTKVGESQHHALYTPMGEVLHHLLQHCSLHSS